MSNNGEGQRSGLALRQPRRGNMRPYLLESAEYYVEQQARKVIVEAELAIVEQELAGLQTRAQDLTKMLNSINAGLVLLEEERDKNGVAKP